MIDLNTILTYEAADEAIDRNINNGGSFEEYAALSEKRDQLWDRAMKLDSPASKPTSATPRLEGLDAKIADAEAKLATLGRGTPEYQQAFVDKRVLSLQAENVEWAARYEQYDDDGLAKAKEDALVKAEELGEFANKLPPGSARKARAEREAGDSMMDSAGFTVEAQRRREIAGADRAFEQWVSSSTDKAVQGLYDRAIALVEGRRTRGEVAEWEAVRAREKREKAREQPFDAKYMANVRSRVEEKVEAKRQKGLRNFAQSGTVFNEADMRNDGSPQAVWQEVADELTESTPDGMKESFVGQLASALIGTQ